MWKDFFYYSKSERRSVIVLVVSAFLLICFTSYLHYSRETELPRVDTICLDSFYVEVFKKQQFNDSVHASRFVKNKKQPGVLVNFDPNVADSATLSSLGLPSFLVTRIINYRNHGGVFRKKEDLARIYGLRNEQYLKLKPYICISKSNIPQPSVDDIKLDSSYNRTSNKHISEGLSITAYQKYPEGTILDLNKVDTIQLKRVPGIGSVLAKMIVAYRFRLGGFVDVNQLQEIKYVDSSINKWFKIETGINRPIKVNRANLDQLRNHPYMDFYKARAIIEYRRKRGKIKGLSQLSMFQEFTEKDLQRLTPYLTFE